MGHVVHVLDNRDQVDAFIAWANDQYHATRDRDTEAIENGYPL
jgi:hypothetical protein